VSQGGSGSSRGSWLIDEAAYLSGLDPIITANARELEVDRQRDPASYLVEYQGQWATISDRYLSASIVDAVFAPLGECHFKFGTKPIPGATSAIHIDMSLSGDNTTLVLAHSEIIDGEVHVVVDEIVIWQPSNFVNGQVDYDEVAATAVRLALAHNAQISIDSFQSMAMVDKITARLRTAGVSGLQVATHSPSVVHANQTEKLQRWESTKTFAAEGATPLTPPPTASRRTQLPPTRRSPHRSTDQRVRDHRRRRSRAAGGATTWTSNQYATEFSRARPSRPGNTISRPEKGRRYR